MDGHDRGARVIARALRDAGMEVIYTGRHVTVDFIARAAVEEDVDVVGLSILSGAHLELFPRIVEELKQRGVDDVLLFCGGIIPEEDTAALENLGVSAVFRPGTNTQDIVKFVYEHVQP
jgi:methylmalonyl-CoA mutase C-terminal domain/subunit